jgi:hypothetical protein
LELSHGRFPSAIGKDAANNPAISSRRNGVAFAKSVRVALAPANTSVETGATMDWLDKISRFWPHLAAGFDFLAALLASVHALLHKRDSRAATLWIGLIWLLPLFGPILYLALGFNRIRRRARLCRSS